MLLPLASYQYWHGWLILVIDLFYKVYPNTFDICFRYIISCVQYGSSLEGPAQLLRVLFFFYVSDVFVGSSKVIREYLQLLSFDLDSLSCPISSGISDLVAVYSSVLPLVWWWFFLGGLDCPPFGYDERCSKIMGGSKLLWGTAPRLREISWEFCTFTSIFLVLLRRRSWRGVSLISIRLFVLAVFPHFLWGG